MKEQIKDLREKAKNLIEKEDIFIVITEDAVLGSGRTSNMLALYANITDVLHKYISVNLLKEAFDLGIAEDKEKHMKSKIEDMMDKIYDKKDKLDKILDKEE